LTYARPKTGISRRCSLWPETVDSLKSWLAIRPKSSDPDVTGLVFVTRTGGCWYDDIGRALSHEIRKLLNSLKIDGNRNFYALRHTFQTIGDESRDFLAVRSVMGHASSDIADAYRERMSEDRLRAVATYVRGWLFGDGAT
jgi:integrase